MYAGPLRQVRALTVGGACVGLSLTGHVVAGGGGGAAHLAPAGLAGLGALATVMCLVLGAASRRRWTFGRAVIALGLTQVALHGAFTWLLGGGHAMAGSGPAGSGLSGSAMAGMGGPGMATGPAPAPGPPGLAMTLGHTVAALLVAALVAWMDGSLHTRSALEGARGVAVAALAPWRLARRTGDAGPHLPHSAAAACRARWPRPRILTDRLVLQGLSRRGPPAAA